MVQPSSPALAQVTSAKVDDGSTVPLQTPPRHWVPVSDWRRQRHRGLCPRGPANTLALTLPRSPVIAHGGNANRKQDDYFLFHKKTNPVL